MSSLAYALRARGKTILGGSASDGYNRVWSPSPSRKYVHVEKFEFLNERKRGKKNLQGWIFDISQLGRPTPEVISGERGGGCGG